MTSLANYLSKMRCVSGCIAGVADGDLTQAEKFAQAARDLGADQDEGAFKGVLRKLAKQKSDAR